MQAFAFTLEAADGAARRGVFRTPHGAVQTPAFMAVGTLATVKALDPDDLVSAGARMILANAYHLHLRPGDDLVREMGGLHRFMQWSGPILTDSGGFQVFSLATLRTVDEDGVEFFREGLTFRLPIDDLFTHDPAAPATDLPPHAVLAEAAIPPVIAEARYEGPPCPVLLLPPGFKGTI